MIALKMMLFVVALPFIIAAVIILAAIATVVLVSPLWFAFSLLVYGFNVKELLRMEFGIGKEKYLAVLNTPSIPASFPPSFTAISGGKK